jgi:hypothetical protein
MAWHWVHMSETLQGRTDKLKYVTETNKNWLRIHTALAKVQILALKEYSGVRKMVAWMDQLVKEFKNINSIHKNSMLYLLDYSF